MDPLSQSASAIAAADSASEPFHPIGNKNTLSPTFPFSPFPPFSPLFSRNVACDSLQHLSDAESQGKEEAKNDTWTSWKTEWLSCIAIISSFVAS